jgi:hypothetical protein
MEADDAMGIAQMKHYTPPENEGDRGYCNSTIVACDKDMDMICGNHYNPVKDIQYWIDDFQGHKNFYKQVLTGDSTDNITGLKGVGKVGAETILKDCKTIDELEKTTEEAYYNKLTETRIGTWELKLKGCTQYYQNKTDYLKAYQEIKSLLWIRRE